jgi:quinol monooxygenase YgiN
LQTTTLNWRKVDFVLGKRPLVAIILKEIWGNACIYYHLTSHSFMKNSLIIMLMMLSSGIISAQKNNMMIRISEIEIDSNYLKEYKSILKEESRASVKLEPGVIAIYPMYQKEHPTQVRILEIYASREAYELHLKTPHFQTYKTTTLKMVKSLKLIDMEAVDEETMPEIFRKFKSK